MARLPAREASADRAVVNRTPAAQGFRPFGLPSLARKRAQELTTEAGFVGHIRFDSTQASFHPIHYL